MASATVQQVIDKAYTKVNGEFEAQLEGSDDWKTYLAVLNQVMDNLAHTPYIKWQIFFNPNFTLGAVVNGTLSYAIAGINGLTIGNSPFDNVYFVDGTGAVVAKYKIVDAAMFQNTTNTQVAMVAGSSLYLKATESKIVGTTIRLPVYADPAPYTAAGQSVVVDSVPWLVASMAAFICASSPVPFIARNADRYEKEAAVFMKNMRENNRRTQALMVKRLNTPSARLWADVMNVMTIQDL
jgi:hypothetical protein